MRELPLAAILLAALAIGFEQVVQSRFGAMGIIAFVLLTVGVKARSVTVGGLGAVVLVMLLAPSN
ncbi:hypothetical protein [Streptomyces sp. NPDC001068]|uniref:hypothetical protein n=1 Tax=Streptomyces sp. NPDC001068 TaxID=3364544 RepID=UPI0036C8310C